MIKWSVLTLSEFFEIAFIVGLFLSFYIKIYNKRIAAWAGAVFLLSLATGFILNFAISPAAFSPRLRDGWTSIIAVIAAGFLLVIMFMANRSANRRIKAEESPSLTVSPGLLLPTVNSVLLFFILLPRFLNFSKTVERLILQSNMFNTNVLAGFAGMAAGVLLSAVLAVAIYKNSKRAALGSILLFFFIFSLPGIASYKTSGIQMLMVEGYLPMDQRLLALLIPMINSQSILKYITYFLGLFFVLIVLKDSRKEQAPDKTNPAEERKIKAHRKKEGRWIAAFIVLVLASYLLAGAQTVIDKEVEIKSDPPKAVKARDGKVEVPLSGISGKKLKKFSYKGAESEVIFMAMHKGSGVYGVAFDACQICGPAGFYQKEENIICIACESVVNKSTLGFPGGCNPIPLQHKIGKGKLIIDEQVLKDAQKIFKK